MLLCELCAFAGNFLSCFINLEVFSPAKAQSSLSLAQSIFEIASSCYERRIEKSNTCGNAIEIFASNFILAAIRKKAETLSSSLFLRNVIGKIKKPGLEE